MLTEEGRKQALKKFLQASGSALVVVCLKDLPAGSVIPLEWADVTEADFSGYARVGWIPVDDPIIDGSGHGKWTSGTHTFTLDTTIAGQTIKALALIDIVGGTTFLMDVMRLSPAITVINAGDKVEKVWDYYSENLVP